MKGAHKREVTIGEIIQSKCKHEWVDLSRRHSRSDQDQQCKKCGLKQMQSELKPKPAVCTVEPKPLIRADNRTLSNYELRNLMGIDRQIHHRGRGGAFRSR